MKSVIKVVVELRCQREGLGAWPLHAGDLASERVELSDVRVSKSDSESVLQFPHAFERRYRDRVV
jgi:hypothetical protein